jgi:septum formation inhibitor-activating ATPase MinD
MNSAVRHLVETYFDNSVEAAMNALITYNNKGLSNEDLDRLIGVIGNSKKKGG